MTSKIYYAVADRSSEQINKFWNRYDYISEQEINDVFKKYWYSLESLEKSQSWWTAHVVYFAKIVGQKERLVFRANAGKKWGFYSPEVSMLTEKIVTDTVKSLWIATNKVLHVDISRSRFPFDYQIEEELIWVDPERHINEKWDFLWEKEEYDALSFELGAAIAAYSEIKYEWFGLPDEQHIQSHQKIIWKNSSFYEYITTNLETHLAYLIDTWFISKEDNDVIVKIFLQNKDRINDCESCLIHHDLADHNIMFNPHWKNKLSWVFDWEAMAIWDPMLDLWSCPTWGTHFERKWKLIEWYSSIKSLPKDYEIRMNLYELRTWIWKLMFVHKMKFEKNVITMQHNWLKQVLSKLQ